MTGVTITHPDGTPTTAQELANPCTNPFAYAQHTLAVQQCAKLFVCTGCGLHAPFEIMLSHVMSCRPEPSEPSKPSLMLPPRLSIDGLKGLDPSTLCKTWYEELGREQVHTMISTSSLSTPDSAAQHVVEKVPALKSRHRNSRKRGRRKQANWQDRDSHI